MVTVEMIDEASDVGEVINVDMTASQALSLGDAYYVDENYLSAVDAYAAALSVKRDAEKILHFRILNHRSGAFFHLGRYQEALEDSREAAKILTAASPVAGLRTGETELCSRREGLSAFKLGNYKDAKVSLEKAAQLAALNKRDLVSYQDWIRQCNEKLTPPAKPAARSPPTTTATLKSPPPPAAVAVAPKTAAPSTPPKQVATAPRPAPTNRKPVAPKYQYYQSDKFMTVSILEPNVKPEDVDANFQAKHLTVKMRKGGMEFTVVAGELYDEVDPTNCRVNVRDEKVLIKLRKVKAFEWHELMSKERKKAAPAPAVPVEEDKNTPVVDTSKPRPYSSHRDWDAIERRVKAEEESEKPEGDEAMNKLFKSLYSGADEDTRRAMVKSYQTSGGTVLSTNWDEVKKKDYEKERTAPKGQEWKTWEGDKLPMKDDD